MYVTQSVYSFCNVITFYLLKHTKETKYIPLLQFYPSYCLWHKICKPYSVKIIPPVFNLLKICRILVLSF